MPEQLETVLTIDDAARGGAREDSPRIHGPFEALARGTDSLGDSFECETTVDELSAADFSLRLGGHVSAGSRLFVVVRLCRARVAMLGSVLNSEPAEGGVRRVRAAILRNRFLS